MGWKFTKQGALFVIKWARYLSPKYAKSLQWNGAEVWGRRLHRVYDLNEARKIAKFVIGINSDFAKKKKRVNDRVK